MRKIPVSSMPFLVVIFLTVGTFVHAATVWNPVANGITPPVSGNWNEAGNWTNGVPVATVPGEVKAQFNVADAAEAVVSDTQSLAHLVQGDNGPGGVIRVIGGGTLNAGPIWHAIGYNNTAKLIVEAGAMVNFGGHCWWGMHTGADSIVEINGGIINGSQSFGLGEWFGGEGDHGQCKVYVNAGELNIHHWTGAIDSDHPVFWNDSFIDISNGSVTIIGNKVDEVNAYVAADKIIAFAGTGEVVVEYSQITDKTYITAISGNETDAPLPDPASFAIMPKAQGAETIVMTATTGFDDSGVVEYYFDEITGNPGGADSGWIAYNSYANTDLAPGTSYTYTVKMRDAFGNEGAASTPAGAATWTAETVTITWNPAANHIYPPNKASWSDAGNWIGATSGMPDGNFKYSFSKDNASECVVTEDHIFNQLVQNVSGSSVLRIKNGGSITTGKNWSGIGYNQKTNMMIVESGGQANFGDHLWIGLYSPSVGVLDIDGGIVNVAGQLGLGWNTGRGTVSVKNGGVLNLNTIDGSRAIGDGSVVDIENGSIIINGDKVSIVADYIATNKITAFGGNGKLVYDYNSTNSGKTTIKAIENVQGDIDGDGGVDIDDLGILLHNWLSTPCGNEANFDYLCKVDLRDFVVLARNWLTGLPMKWHIVETVYPTEDYVISPYWAEDFGIVADGITDVTEAIQTALISINNLGGGTLFLPAGKYKVSGNLTIPSRVTLRGDWQKPQAGSPIVGTILQAYAGRDDVNGIPFIELSNSSGLRGIAIWYPEQMPTDIQPYPPTIHGGGVTLENITLVNSYFGFTTYLDGTTACPFVRGVYGTPLYIGTEYDRLADIGRIESIHFSPAYWADSGLPNAPTAGEHEAWIYNNGTGMIVRRIDWSYSCYVTVEGYNTGLALRPSRWAEDSGSTPNGQSYGFNLIGCKTGIYIEKSAYAGYQFTRFNIKGAETGVYLSSSATEATMFHTCIIDASGDAVLCEGTAKIMMMSCDIQCGTLDINGGYLSVINSDFAVTAGNHIELASDVHGASILGNRFAGGAKIVDSTSYPVNIDHTDLAVDPLPDYDYKKPTKSYKPAKPDVFVVTRSPYNAKGDGVTDDTTAFEMALAEAALNGGGTVFVPGSNYRIDGNLVIPTGVELRGVFDIAHDTRVKGSLINIYGGRNDANGTPTIQLESDSGIRGLTFHYPEQIYDETDTVNYGMKPYPFLMRGLGADIYIINIAATIPYQILDLATFRCDRHYVDYVKTTALKTGIHVGNGSTDGQIHNCQFNPSLYTHQGLYYDSIPLDTSDNIHKILWRDATPYLFGHMVNEVLHENFVFGGAQGMHLVEENGQGPSGYCLGMGVDQCTNAFQIDNIGSKGLDVINSQIVTVNATAGRYLEVGVDFNDTFRMFSSAGWGSHQYSAVVNGGDVKLQLFHLARDGETGAFKVANNANLENLGGDLRDYLGTGRPYLTIDSTATAKFVGNIINTTSAQIPTESSNVISIGNLRVQ
ncbi:MAG: hypothetical protein JEZ07_11170 [Phycisphaerae bacterium]|nr:hypothetical protein [Phycisphaerae bacterium]